MNDSMLGINGSVSQAPFNANSCTYGPIPTGKQAILQYERFCSCQVLDVSFLDTLLVEEIISKFFLAISVIGNLFVIIVLNRMKRGFFNAPMKALLQNLSITDMTVCILYNVNESTSKNSSLTTNAACKIFGGLLWAALSSSSCAVCCVSMERYLAVVKPLEFNLTKKKAMLMIVFSWYYSLLFTLPDFYFLERIFVGPICLQGIISFCYYTHWQGVAVKTLNVVSIIATFVIPLIIVVYTNVAIIVIMLKTAKANKSKGIDQGNSKKRSGVIMIVLLLTVVYVICSVPFIINYLLTALPPKKIKIDQNFAYVAYYLMLANSSCNPFIYSFFSAEFRKECVNLISLPCRWVKDKLDCV